MELSALLPSKPKPQLWPIPHNKTPSASSPRCLLSCSFALPYVIVSLCLFGHAPAQEDPVKDFCRRFGHQTALIDRNLYIDGGFVNWPTLEANYSNQWLSYQALDVPGSAGMPQLYANLSKNESIPDVNGGILWADDVNKKFYLFGGEYYQVPPNPLELYEYDVLEDIWKSLGASTQGISAVSYGAGVSISSTGQAYYYGGWLSNDSMPDWTGSRLATGGLVQYDMDAMTWSNGTGPDDKKRAEGVMVYIPASDGGMLVYFGGVMDEGNGTIVGQPMEEIFVYDIYSSKWYSQTADGDIPAMRSRFCAGATWASDQSSYNIYLYGGRGMPPSTAGFDDVYILSLPSFTWIKFYPSDNTTNQYPHNTLSCNVVDNAQMIIIGGTFPLDDTSCDVPDQWGSHNLDLGKQNNESALWHLYDPEITSYAVPDEILTVVGGGAQGGATKTAPAGGFQSADLAVYMTRRFTAAARTPTRAISGAAPSEASHQALSKGAIAGIAVGAAVAFIAFLAGCFWFVRRHRTRKQQQYSQNQWAPNSLSYAPAHNPQTPLSPYAPSSFMRRTYPPAPAELDGVAMSQPVSGFQHHELQSHHHDPHPIPVSPQDEAKLDGGGSWSGAYGTHDINLTPTTTAGLRPTSTNGTGDFVGGAHGLEGGGGGHGDGYHREDAGESNRRKYTAGGFGPTELGT
ncbi:hypothetical protein F4778DRAFT_786364 [Xylariomycetidae sp. FL2044]|nr:hypothetical protein F4778DRAFT_786364 [Xylariomycetidae sp. FL2044]